MRSRPSEALVLLPLLPVFILGIFPMLLFGLLGFAGISLFGILLVCVGLADGLNASSDFSQQVIVHGYADRDHRSMHSGDLRSATRFALAVDVVGLALVAVGIIGFFCFGGAKAALAPYPPSFHNGECIAPTKPVAGTFRLAHPASRSFPGVSHAEILLQWRAEPEQGGVVPRGVRPAL